MPSGRFERAAPSAADPEKTIDFESKFTFKPKLESGFDLNWELKLLKFQLIAFKFKANRLRFGPQECHSWEPK